MLLGLWIELIIHYFYKFVILEMKFFEFQYQKTINHNKYRVAEYSMKFGPTNLSDHL